MRDQTIIQIAHYAAPYKGNFIASLEVLEEKLIKDNNRVVYVFPKRCRNTPWIEEFRKIRVGGVQFIDEPTPRFKVIEDKNCLKQLKTIIEEYRPAIIHSHFDGYDSYCVKANTVGAKVIWHHHNTRELVNNPVKRLYQRITLRYQYGVLGKRAEIVIIGKDFQNEIQSHGYHKQAFLLPNGIQESRIQFSDKQEKEYISFLNFGGRAHQKGLDVLLKAVNRLVKEEQKFTVLITDGVDTRSVVQDYFGESIPNQIRIVSQTENIQERFHSCDWFISASRHETFSYAIAEAMLSGTPILSSEINGVSWCFGQSSVVSFESENDAELANRMRDIIEGKIKKTSSELQKSREFILQQYTADVWARKLVSFYGALLE